MRADEIKLPEGPGTRGDGNGNLPADQTVVLRWKTLQQKAALAKYVEDGNPLYLAIDRETCSPTDYDFQIEEGFPFILGSDRPQLFTTLAIHCATALRYAPGAGQNATVLAWSI